MRNRYTFWLICLSLVFTSLLGTHVHACTGIEAGTPHASAHYADNGWVFGDHHRDDDGDDSEVQFVAMPGSHLQLESSERTFALAAHPEVAAPASPSLTLAAPRGPPSSRASHPPHFIPPLRGPPISQA